MIDPLLVTQENSPRVPVLPCRTAATPVRMLLVDCVSHARVTASKASPVSPAYFRKAIGTSHLSDKSKLQQSQTEWTHVGAEHNVSAPFWCEGHQAAESPGCNGMVVDAQIDMFERVLDPPNLQPPRRCNRNVTPRSAQGSWRGYVPAATHIPLTPKAKLERVGTHSYPIVIDRP